MVTQGFPPGLIGEKHSASGVDDEDQIARPLKQVQKTKLSIDGESAPGTSLNSDRGSEDEGVLFIDRGRLDSVVVFAKPHNDKRFGKSSQ